MLPATTPRSLRSIIIAASLLVSFNVFAQSFEVPDKQPSSKEEFVSTEKDIIAAANWLESTAIGTDKEKRINANAWVMIWITNSPTVTIELRQSIFKLFDKNPDLLMVYMAGYARYCLENSYSKDQLKCNAAGIKAAINCYNLGGDIKKEKLMNKVIEKDKEGKLEGWVKEALESK